MNKATEGERKMNRRMFALSGGAVLVGLAGVGASFAANGTLGGYIKVAARQRAPFSGTEGLRDIVRYATLAANGHNTQPWRFRAADTSIHIEPDLARRTPVVDPDDHHLFVSLGCAAENLVLAARATGIDGEVHFDGGDEGALIFTSVRTAEQTSDLFGAIPHRQSTRAEFDGRTLSAADLALLRNAAQEPGVDAVILTERPALERLRDLVVEGNRQQVRDAAFVAELGDWMRFNPRAAITAGDGLFSGSTGNPSLPGWIGRRLFSGFLTAEAENEKYARQVLSSSGAIVFSGVAADAEHWVKVGRACQRFALQATALGLKHAFVNQPVEVPGLRGEIASLADIGQRRPDIVMRFGYGPDLPKSLRRPVDAVLEGVS
jgi:hypothetical protein